MAERQLTRREDALVRGWVYVSGKQLLERTEALIAEERLFVERVRYEREILSRVAERTDSEAIRESLNRRIEANEGLLSLAESRLEGLEGEAEVYRAVVAETEADLGELAAEYEDIIRFEGDEGKQDGWEDLFEDDEFLYEFPPADVPLTFDDEFPDDSEDFLADMKEIEVNSQ